jgi:hypothetical protein
MNKSSKVREGQPNQLSGQIKSWLSKADVAVELNREIRLSNQQTEVVRQMTTVDAQELRVPFTFVL